MCADPPLPTSKRACDMLRSPSIVQKHAHIHTQHVAHSLYPATNHRNGFVVDDGPFRTLEDPANEPFLRDMARGCVPPDSAVQPNHACLVLPVFLYVRVDIAFPCVLCTSVWAFDLWPTDRFTLPHKRCP